MKTISGENFSTHGAETSEDTLFHLPHQLARAVLPHLVVNEAADAPFVEVEDTLTQLNVNANERLVKNKKPTRRLRRSLSRYAHRMLEITDQEPDLLNTHSISLLGQTYDATGERDILETTLEQAKLAHVSADTDMNLLAIQAALELDKPFGDVMRTLNKHVVPFPVESASRHDPVGTEYDFLFSPAATHPVNRYTAPTYDIDGTITDYAVPTGITEEALAKK